MEEKGFRRKFRLRKSENRQFFFFNFSVLPVSEWNRYEGGGVIGGSMEGGSYSERNS